MPYELPMSIKNEQDLKAFESYLNNDVKRFSNAKSENSLKNRLQNQTGKFIMLETVFGLRKGRLLEVGNDFLSISCKAPQNQMLINFSKINSFILPREN